MVEGQAPEPEQFRLFPGGINLGKLRDVQESLRAEESRSRQTVRGYSSDVRIFERWCRDAGRDHLPCTAETIALYVIWMMTEGGRKASTVSRHVSAVVDLHRRSDLPVPSTADAWGNITRMRKKRGEKSEGKAALTAGALRAACQSCDGSTLAGLRDHAVLVLGFACALRRSEIAALQLSDVGFRDKGVVLTIRRSKTDQEGRGVYLPAWPGRRALTDPVRVLRAWIAARGMWPGPLFSRIYIGDRLSKNALSGDAVNDLVKRKIAAAGIEPDSFGAHSLRAGAVTAAAELGGTDTELMGLSRHRSMTVMRGYIRPSRVFTGRNPLAGVL
jgi:integrase